MFLYLVISCTFLALFISLAAIWFFSKPIKTMLLTILPEDLASSWLRYINYMIIVIGIGGGVSIYRFEKYLEPTTKNEITYTLTPERWTLELYDTLLNTLSSIGWLIFWLFLASMIAFVILKVRKKHD